MYPDESSPSFFFSNYDIFISPFLSFLCSLEGSRSVLRIKKGFEIFFFLLLAPTFYHSSLRRVYFYPGGGTCKVDVSRNKIKLKIASIVTVSFVILRHLRAGREKRRCNDGWRWLWCGNVPLTARKRMRPKKNRYNRLSIVLPSWKYREGMLVVVGER